MTGSQRAARAEMLQRLNSIVRSAQTTIGGRHHTPAWHSARTVTAVCTNLAIIMERTDEQILPAVYNFIGRTFDATPSQLGALTLSRAFMQAITSPVGGVLGESCRSSCPVAKTVGNVMT